MANVSHPSFTQPQDNPTIWRYMNFTKFVQMLDTSALYFCRADLFEDPFEGSFTRPAIETRQEMLRENANGAFEKLRQWHYISCWHMSMHESEAMWRLYGQYHEAVAIRTSYQKLAAALPDEVYLGVVRYLDYERDQFDPTEGFNPFMHKRLAFQHKREVRGILREPSLPAIHELSERHNPCGGKSVPLALPQLIDSVIVSPLAPLWFAELVANIVTKLGHDLRIEISEIARDPLF